MSYKAIVLDLDGTLMNSNNQITKKTQELLIKIQKLGIKVIIATGRPTQGILRVIELLKLKQFGGYVLSYNGGRIIDMNDNSLIFDSYLEKDMILDLFDQSRLFKTHLLAYTDQFILTEDSDQYIDIESQINEIPVVRVHKFKDELKNRSVKCLMTGEPNHLINVETQLKAIYHDQLSISRSLPFFLECMPIGINKGNCLTILLNHIHMDKSEVIACGDGYNDISLIEAVGLGIAMSNGCEPLKEKAKYITLSNDDDGVAHVIEKFILNQFEIQELVG